MEVDEAAQVEWLWPQWQGSNEGLTGQVGYLLSDLSPTRHQHSGQLEGGCQPLRVLPAVRGGQELQGGSRPTAKI